MKVLLRKIIGICCIFYAIIFINLFIFSKFEKAISKELDVPLYIIEDESSSELFIDKSNLEKYKIEEINLIDLNLNKEVSVSPVNERFFIYEKLKNNNEYVFQVKLIDNTTRKRAIYKSNFKYLDNRFSVQNITMNSCQVNVSYDRKNLIFIDEIGIYTKDSESKNEGYEFKLKKDSSELNNYKNRVEFKEINLKPSSTYDIYCVVKMNTNVNIVSKKKIKTKNFEISEFKSRMVSDRKIKLDWNISNKNLKFLEKDSIKIYAKEFGELNYSAVPNFKITDEDVYSTIIEMEKVSPKYEIKIVYNLCGKQIEKDIEQINDFYKLNSNVSVSDLRNVKIKFGFDNKFKFKDDEILNIYLIDEVNDSISPQKIFSQKVSSIEFNPYYKIEFNNLKLDNDYKIVYEISYKDGTAIKIKEDKFKTLNFGIKKFDVSSTVDKQNNLKVNLSWELSKPKFEFLEGDNLAIYIKEKSSSNYPNKPYFYRDTELNNTFSFDIDINNELKGEYDIKLVYNVGGKEYVNFKDLYINYSKENIKTFNRNVPLNVVSQEQIGEKKAFEVKVKDTKPNEATLEFVYPKDFQFIEGDILEIYKKEEKSSSAKSEVLYAQYIHSKESDISKPEPQPTPEQPENKPEGVEDETEKPKNELQEPQISKKVNLKSMTSVTVDYLVPNKDYEFKVVLKTNNEINDNIGTEIGGGNPVGSDEEKEEEESSIPLVPIEPIEPSETEEDSAEVPQSPSTEEEEELENSEDTQTPSNEQVLRKSSVRTDSAQSIHTKEVKVKAKTEEFKIKTFTTKTIRPNSAVFEWGISENITNFNEKDKLEIYVKRKIVGGYPPGNSFLKTGSEINGVLSGEAIVQHMNMEYTAKIVYTISGVKFENTVDFTTKSGTTSCSISNINEYSAKLDIVYPEEYKFLNGDSLEVYLKESQEKTFGDSPVFKIFHEEDQNLQDITSFNFIDLKPKMVYDVLVKFINRPNDIPDAKAQFVTSALVLENCRIDSMMGERLRIKTETKNSQEVFDNIPLYGDVFYKPSDKVNYLSKPIFSGYGPELLDFEFKLPYLFNDYDFLVSFNPHGFFNDTLFIEFELEYRIIRAVVNETEIEEDNVKRKSYELKWAYPQPINFSPNDKINIYLREIIEDTSLNENIDGKNISGYTKIHTIDSKFEENNSLNLDYFISENKKYEFAVEIVSDKFKAGTGKTELEVGKIKEEQENVEEDVIFDVPITVEDFNGIGDRFTFSLPDLGDVDLTEEMDIICDVEGLSIEFVEEGISVKGLVPGKQYENIEIRILVEEGKELIFNIENIKLEPEEDVQEFLYNVYQRAFLRDPDEGGYQYWLNRLKTKDISARDFLINLLFAEKEFSEMKYNTEKFISVLYSIIVDRDPDDEGLKFWIDFYNNDALKNSNGDVFVAKKYIVDRMINEKEFEKLILGMNLKY